MKNNITKNKFISFALPQIGAEEIEEVVDTLKTGWVTTGPKTKKFEDDFSKFTNTKYTLAVNSCTSALHLALVALDIKEGDEVLVPSLTFTATAEVITYLKAKPVFIDCDPETFLIDIKDIEKNITKKTKAIIPVHFAGQSADIDAIKKIAKKYKLKVIWDAAHSFPAFYKGKNIAKFADIVCFSFYATKTITTGEGGMVVTNNQKYFNKMKIAALHGLSRDAWNRYKKGGSWYYDVVMPGYKYNLTDIASSIGIHQLKKANLFLDKRNKIASEYTEAFKNIPEISVPRTLSYGTHAWHLYVIKIDFSKLRINRNDFIKEMNKWGIGCSVHFIPLHLQSYWKNTYKLNKNNFPGIMKIHNNIISLPIYPKMISQDIKRVKSAVISIINNNKK